MMLAAILLLLQEPSASVSALVTKWQAGVIQAQEEAATQSWGSELAAELAIRTAGDQAAREGLMRLRKSATNEQEKAEAGNIIIARLERMDLDNTAFLKGNLPPEGWFRKSRHGSAVPSMAWLIVQHSRDRDFQKKVVERMEPLVAQGEVSGRGYALLFDRVAMFEGRPQRYGSQARCENSELRLYKLEDAEKVDALRQEVGMGTLAEYQQQLGIGEAC